MTISKELIDFIKEKEGFRATAYKCPGGIWTIGYGHTKGVKKGQTVTKSQAEGYLMDDLSATEDQVMAACSKYMFPLTQGRYDALVSFTYNCGPGNLNKLIKGRTVEEVRKAFSLYTHSAGKELPGLVKRRKEEIELFFDRKQEYDPIYYGKYIGTSERIDDVFAAVGVPLCYIGNWKKRIPVAEANLIRGYTGTARQNLSLIAEAKRGLLKKPL